MRTDILSNTIATDKTKAVKRLISIALGRLFDVEVELRR